jgi:ABC-2 type transport system permease protein
LLFVISWPAQAGGSSFSDFLRYLSLPDHFAQMVTGIIDTRDIVYFLSLIFVALFLTQRSVESARWR